MALYKGKEGVVTFTPDAGSETTIGQVTNYEIGEEIETVDGTVMGSPARINEPLFTAWSGTVSGLWDKADAGQLASIGGATGALHVYPEGRGAGNVKIGGNVTINGRTRNAEVGALIGYSLTFQSRGALVEGEDA